MFFKKSVSVVVSLAILLAMSAVLSACGLLNALEDVDDLADASIESLEASSGEQASHVLLEWHDVENATEYLIYRDEELIDTVSESSYEDTGARPGGLPEAPQLEASQGEFLNRVILNWTEPEIPEGRSHDYYVVARNEFGDSPPSAVATGYRRGYPIDSYQLRVDNSTWIDVGLVNTFEDDNPRLPLPGEEDFLVSRGTHTDFVRLRWTPPSPLVGPSMNYQVRAYSDAGNGEVSQPAEGYTGGNEPEIQWQRSVNEEGQEFEDIDGATTFAHDDVGAPEDGTPRQFRARLSEDEAEILTDGHQGFRAVGPLFHMTRSRMISRYDDLRRVAWEVNEGNAIGQISAIATDPDGYIYVGTYAGEVVKYSPEGQRRWVFTEHTDFIASVAVDGDGNVYAGSWDETISKISPDGELVWFFTDTEDRLNNIAVDSVGNLYACGRADIVRKIAPSGDQLWSAAAAPIYQPRALTVSADGDSVYIAQAHSEHGVVAISADGQVFETIYEPAIYNLALDAQGGLLVENTEREVLRLDADGNELWSFSGPDNPRGIYLDRQGNAFSHWVDGRVRRHDEAGDPIWTYQPEQTVFSGPMTVDMGLVGAFPEGQ